jgi:hemoglobin-like flavoprotein
VAGMKEKDLEIFNESLDQCMKDPRFLDRFYELFLASTPEVAEKFKNTDMLRQKRILKTSLYMLMLAAQGLDEGMQHLEQIAQRHSRDEIDIPPHLYDLWLNCLIQAVKEFDPAYNLDTERAWRVMMMHGIKVMKDRY